jgi:4-carboxymuconolactone decarboxylase
MTADQSNESGEAKSRQELRQRGAEVLSQLGHGTAPPRPRPLYLASVGGMQHYTSDALWGSVWSRPDLTMRIRVLVTVSILASLQRMAQLRTYLNSALNVGVDVTEVREALIQCAAFAGFPTTVNALELLREVLEGRGLPIDTAEVTEVELDELDGRGLKLQQQLFGAASAVEVAGAQQVLALIERRFVFGEIFHRPGLDLLSRAICALASTVALRMPEEERAWIGACLRVGIEPATVGGIVVQSAYYVGFPAAREAMRIANEVLPAD